MHLHFRLLTEFDGQEKLIVEGKGNKTFVRGVDGPSLEFVLETSVSEADELLDAPEVEVKEAEYQKTSESDKPPVEEKYIRESTD